MTYLNCTSSESKFQLELKLRADQEKTPVVGFLIPPNTVIRYPKSKMISRSKQWRVKVKCPWCSCWHFHGWDPNEPEEKRVRTRTSHCFHPDVPFSGYTIYTPEEWDRGLPFQNRHLDNLSGREEGE